MKKMMKVMVLVMCCMMIAACGKGYSEGSRAGVVTKFSKKGFVWKSYEGELNLGGFTRGAEGGVVANVFRFSVTDPKVAEKINAALNSGTRVELAYSQWVVAPPTQCSKYEVVAVK